MENIRIRVQRGSRLLDEKVPGWFERVDVGKLETSNIYRCVLGQMYGSYFGTDLTHLGAPSLEDTQGYRSALNEWAIPYGFAEPGQDYLHCDEFWREEVAMRFVLHHN